MANKSKYSREGANRLFDHLLRTYKIKNDSALAAELGISRPGLSKIRNGFVGMGDSVVIAIHDVFDMSIKDIKGMLSEQG